MPPPRMAKLRRFKEFYDGAASWDRVERIIARVEAGPRAPTRASSSPASTGSTARTVYQDIYCARGQAENHIKAWKTHLAADRTSCCRATANQLRLFLHARRLLADVEPAHADAAALDLARRAVRHVAPASHQARRARRRNENHDQGSLADSLPRTRCSASRARANAAPRHLSAGAACPSSEPFPSTHKPPSTPRLPHRGGRRGPFVIESRPKISPGRNLKWPSGA